METITTIATVSAILALVNLAKLFGVVGRWSTALAVFLGVLIQVSEFLALSGEPATVRGVYLAIATGLILGLSAAGLYDVAATIGGKAAVVDVVPAMFASSPVLEAGVDQADPPRWDAAGDPGERIIVPDETPLAEH